MLMFLSNLALGGETPSRDVRRWSACWYWHTTSESWYKIDYFAEDIRKVQPRTLDRSKPISLWGIYSTKNIARVQATSPAYNRLKQPGVLPSHIYSTFSAGGVLRFRTNKPSPPRLRSTPLPILVEFPCSLIPLLTFRNHPFSCFVTYSGLFFERTPSDKYCDHGGTQHCCFCGRPLRPRGN